MRVEQACSRRVLEQDTRKGSQEERGPGEQVNGGGGGGLVSGFRETG